MNFSSAQSREGADPYAPDGPYAFARLGFSLLIATLVCAGMWAVIVVLPEVQREFGVDRAAASLPYTLMMFGLAFGTIVMGRMADRIGIVVPLVLAALVLAWALSLRALRQSVVFSAAHGLLIGVGAGTGFAPMMADISHWFVSGAGWRSSSSRRAIIWPARSGRWLMNLTMPIFGWRGTYMAIGVLIAATVIPLAWMRRRPSAQCSRGRGGDPNRAADVGLSPRLLLALLV